MVGTEEIQFGKYTLLDRIAVGGMAEIYRARQMGAAGVTKPVVIKKILPHYAGNGNFVSMFINEAKIVVGLSHGNIAQVFDFGEIDGEYFLAMEYVPGMPLSKVLRRAHDKGLGVVPAPFAISIAMEVCKGLQYAHTRLDEAGHPLNIIHRDVSPQNVILSYEGQVKIVDFGIAKARNTLAPETEAGAVKGKYAYFAPEQARGKDLDARTDVFACGIVLYEMLCGRLPFEGKMMDALKRIVRGEFPRPREVNADLTPALERIVLTAMAHEKAERYQSAEEMQQALATYLYAHAPAFSSSSLSAFMHFLFEAELKAEGVPVKIPQEFLDQLPVWRKPPPSQTIEDATSPATSVERPHDAGEQTGTMGAAPDVPTTFARPQQGLGLWVLVGVPLASMLLAALMVLAIGHFGNFSVQLTSTPPGAAVTVDGRAATAVTPLLISDLSASSSHRLEVLAEGHRPWSQEVGPARGKVLSVHAELEPDDSPQARQAPPTAPPPPKVLEASYQAGKVLLLAAQHAFAVPPSRAARLRLDASRTYRLSTEGKLGLGPTAEATVGEVVYYLEGQGVPAGETFGLVGPKGATIKNASALYAFVLDPAPVDNTGGLKVKVQDKAGGPASLLEVDAREHALSLAPDQRFTVTGLDELATYEVTLQEGSPPARIRAGAEGRLSSVVVLQTPGLSTPGKKPASPLHLLQVGKKLRLTGARWLQLTVPDDALADNEGGFELLVAPAPPAAPSPPPAPKPRQAPRQRSGL